MATTQEQIRSLLKKVGGSMPSKDLLALLEHEGIHVSNLAREMRKIGAKPRKQPGDRYAAWSWYLPSEQKVCPTCNRPL